MRLQPTTLIYQIDRTNLTLLHALPSDSGQPRRRLVAVDELKDFLHGHGSAEQYGRSALVNEHPSVLEVVVYTRPEFECPVSLFLARYRASASKSTQWPRAFFIRQSEDWYGSLGFMAVAPFRVSGHGAIFSPP